MGQRSLPGNAFYIWDVSGNTPGLLDSAVVSGAIAKLADIQISDDGKYLVVATEFAPGYLVVYDLADPRHPREISRFSNELTAQGSTPRNSAGSADSSMHFSRSIRVSPRGSSSST